MPQALFKKVRMDVRIPERSHSTDAGYDLSYQPGFHAAPITLVPGGFGLFKTGVSVSLPENSVGFVCPRSGLAAKKGVTVLNAPGVVDQGYTGEIKVILINHGRASVNILPGDRIAQLVITPIIPGLIAREGEERGQRGFGSTGD